MCRFSRSITAQFVGKVSSGQGFDQTGPTSPLDSASEEGRNCAEGFAVSASPVPKTADSGGWLRFVHLLGLGTKLYILLLAAALPLCVVAGYQALSSWTTSRAIAREFPVFEGKRSMNGVLEPRTDA